MREAAATCRLMVNLSPELWKRIERLATASELKIGPYARMLLIEALEARGCRVVAESAIRGRKRRRA